MPITIQFLSEPGETTATIQPGPGAVGTLPSNPVTVPAVNASGIGVLTISSWTTRPDGLFVIESAGHKSNVRIVAGIDEYEFLPEVQTGSAEEIVDEIVSRGITAVPVQSGVTSSGNLELVQGDTYNGTAKPLLSFPTSASYTDGWTATLTIRDKDDAVIATASGVVASSTQVTVSFTAPTGLTFSGCPGVWLGHLDHCPAHLTVFLDQQRWLYFPTVLLPWLCPPLD
jgi:hypothetical protein